MSGTSSDPRVVGAELRGYEDGMADRHFPPDLSEDLYASYMSGRIIAIQTMGPRPKPPGLFDTPFCREILAKEIVDADGQ